MPKTWLHRLWGSMEEPRKVTAVMVAMYVAAAATAVGFALIPTPHPIPKSHAALQLAMVLLFGLGGLIGAPSAWLGRWWVERVAAMACLGGTIVVLFDAVVLLLPGGPTLVAPVLTLSAAVSSFGLYTTRLIRVQQRPYAPGRGPETPEIQADKLLAHIIAEDQQHHNGGHNTDPGTP